MSNNTVATFLVIIIAAAQCSCISYVKQTQRVDIKVAENLSRQQNIKDASILEVITKSGERITFEKIPPAQIRDGNVVGTAIVIGDLEIKREDIAGIRDETPERMTVLAKDGSVYHFDSYSHQKDRVTGKGVANKKLTIPVTDIQTTWFSYKKMDLKRSRHKTWSTIGLGLLAYCIYYISTHDIM